jgi:hypothetical protein
MLTRVSALRIKLALVIVVTIVMTILLLAHVDGVNGPIYWRWPWRRMPGFLLYAGVALTTRAPTTRAPTMRTPTTRTPTTRTPATRTANTRMSKAAIRMYVTSESEVTYFRCC